MSEIAGKLLVSCNVFFSNLNPLFQQERVIVITSSPLCSPAQDQLPVVDLQNTVIQTYSTEQESIAEGCVPPASPATTSCQQGGYTFPRGYPRYHAQGWVCISGVGMHT